MSSSPAILVHRPEFDIVAGAGRLYYNVNTQQAWIDRYQSDPAKYWGIFQCDPAEVWYGRGFADWLDKRVADGAKFSCRQQNSEVGIW
ncbi:MAG: hypothetical protein U0401_07450 [Anaerolineae bacterium]